MALTITAGFSLTGNQTKTFEGSTLKHTVSLVTSKAFQDGTAINQTDLLWLDIDRTLNATTENIDLSGSLTDAFGDAVVFAKVNGIAIHNNNTTAGQNLTIGGAGANTFLLFSDATDKYVLGPDGLFFLNEPSVAGKTVTAATGDILLMDAGASNITYDIAIWGRSA